MNKNVEPKYRTGGPNRPAAVKGASQIGASQGAHVTERRRELDFSGVSKPVFDGGSALNPAPLGNQVAATTKCGPGGSRNIYRSGAQQGLQTRQMPKGRSFDS
jgi:hypothetical protein